MISIWISLSSVTLHYECPGLMFADVGPIRSEMQQSIGRVYRFGQLHALDAYLLPLDHSHDQVLQAHFPRKITGRIAAQASISLTKEDNALPLSRACPAAVLRI